MEEKTNLEELETPYPLARKFYLRLLPSLILLLVGLVVLVGFVVRDGTQNIHLERATRTAENIANDLSQRVPNSWKRLMNGEKLSNRELLVLEKEFSKERIEYRLTGLKVYDINGRVLFSHLSKEIGKIEKGAALRAVVSSRTPSALRHLQEDGSVVYELYVPYEEAGRLAAVFELYEPDNGALQTTIRDMVVPVVSILMVLFIILILLFVPVVKRAQSEINDRTNQVIGFRRRLEKLLSSSAIETMKQSDSSERSVSKRTNTTLLYSDIRNFTPFCEGRAPDKVIDTLNTIIDVQVNEIKAQGGDVDKIIGDAVLARFDSEGREHRALKAAIAIQEKLATLELPLKIGIGIYSGPVVVGLLGTKDRMDHTVIGDSVNVAARLCSIAKAQQIVTDVDTLKISKITGFGVPHQISIKGRKHTVDVQVWE